MRVITTERLIHWTTGAGLVALGGLGWGVMVPGGVFWSAALAAGLLSMALTTAAVMRSRAKPTLPQVIEIAERAEALRRPGGER